MYKDPLKRMYGPKTFPLSFEHTARLCRIYLYTYMYNNLIYQSIYTYIGGLIL